MDTREAYDEVNALFGAITKALDIGPEEAACAIERGEITMAMRSDEQGGHYVALDYRGKSVRLYQGAIQYAPETPAVEEPDESCDHGGCGCGR